MVISLTHEESCSSVNLRSGSIFISRLDVNGRNRKTTIISATTKLVQLTFYCSMRLRGFNFKEIYFFYKQMLQMLFWSGVKISFAPFTTVPLAS